MIFYVQNNVSKQGIEYHTVMLKFFEKQKKTKNTDGKDYRHFALRDFTPSCGQHFM